MDMDIQSGIRYVTLYQKYEESQHLLKGELFLGQHRQDN